MKAGLAAARKGCMQAVWVLAGLLFVRRDIFRQPAASFHFEHGQEPVVLILAFLEGLVSQRLKQLEPAPERSLKEENRSALSLAALVILYVACAALAAKLSCGIIFPAGVAQDDVRWFGIGVCACGLSLRLWACLCLGELLRQLTEASQFAWRELGPYQWLRYPDRLGQLFLVVGIAFVFATWVPLLAVPGVFVLLRWQVATAEAYRISQIGERYLAYKKSTKMLLPLIY